MIKRSILAGTLIAFGCLFSMSVASYGNAVQGLCFSVGLFGVLCCGARLFTGSVLQVRRVWDNQETVPGLLRLWAGIWAWNFVGALCVALMAHVMGYDASAAAQAKAALPWHELVVRAFMCNVMVCMAVRINQDMYPFNELSDRFFDYAAETFFACLLPVACFVACGYEHSVADMLYMPLGLMNGAVGWLDCARVIGLATVGNLVGGVAFTWLRGE